MTDVLQQRAAIEAELKKLRRQFMDKARTARSFRVQVESMEGLAALSRSQYAELAELRKRIDENEVDLREIQRQTTDLQTKHDKLGKMIRKRRTETIEV